MPQHWKITFRPLDDEQPPEVRVCCQGFNDYALCGLTLDGQLEQIDATEITKERINCAVCIQTIRIAKQVRVSEITKDKRTP
jgi:hypothetical protein